MSMELIIFLLIIILGGIIISLPSIIQYFKNKNKVNSIKSTVIHDRKGLDSYLNQDKKTLLNQISRIKLDWNSYCKELKEINYDLLKLYENMKNGVSVEESDIISSNYEFLKTQKIQIEKICRELKYDLRNLNRVYSIIDTTW